MPQKLTNQRNKKQKQQKNNKIGKTDVANSSIFLNWEYCMIDWTNWILWYLILSNNKSNMWANIAQRKTRSWPTGATKKKSAPPKVRMHLLGHILYCTVVCTGSFGSFLTWRADNETTGGKPHIPPGEHMAYTIAVIISLFHLWPRRWPKPLKLLCSCQSCHIDSSNLSSAQL